MNNNTVDKRMLLIMDTLISTGAINFKSDFCEEIGLLKQNLYNIEQGNNSFTVNHILQVVKIYNVNADWIFTGRGNPFKKDTVSS